MLCARTRPRNVPKIIYLVTDAVDASTGVAYDISHTCIDRYVVETAAGASVVKRPVTVSMLHYLIRKLAWHQQMRTDHSGHLDAPSSTNVKFLQGPFRAGSRAP